MTTLAFWCNFIDLSTFDSSISSFVISSMRKTSNPISITVAGFEPMIKLISSIFFCRFYLPSSVSKAVVNMGIRSSLYQFKRHYTSFWGKTKPRTCVIARWVCNGVYFCRKFAFVATSATKSSNFLLIRVTSAYRDLVTLLKCSILTLFSVRSTKVFFMLITVRSKSPLYSFILVWKVSSMSNLSLHVCVSSMMASIFCVLLAKIRYISSLKAWLARFIYFIDSFV